MSRLSFAVAVGATMVLLGSAGAALARGGGTPPPRACAVDLKALCGSVKPGGGRVRACFESHMSELSGPCSAKLSRVAYVAKECTADIKQFCGDVKRAGDLQACMKGEHGKGQQALQRCVDLCHCSP